MMGKAERSYRQASINGVGLGVLCQWACRLLIKHSASLWVRKKHTIAILNPAAKEGIFLQGTESTSSFLPPRLHPTPRFPLLSPTY